MKVFIISIITYLTTLFSCENIDIYVGRYAQVTNPIYNKIGVPVEREWLTSNEWKGLHIKNPIKRKKFKLWKKHKINEFIDFMCIAAIEESKVYPDIPPEIIVAQAILESNYGFSKLCHQSNNYYGHKYWGKNKNAYVVAHDDSPTDRFRKFKSKWWSIRSHSKLLTKKYRHRIKGKPTIEAWCKAFCGGNTTAKSKRFVKAGGQVYATSCYKGVCYGNKIKHLIKRLHLKKLIKKHGKQDNKTKRVRRKMEK